MESLRHLLLPAVVLGTGLAAVIMRQTRSAMLESLCTDYVRTARAKGLRSGAVVSRHALRNSLIVVITIVGLQLGGAHLRRRGHRADLRAARLRQAHHRRGVHSATTR